MIKIALCEDDEQDLLKISRYLEKYKENNFEEQHIAYAIFPNSVDLLTAIENGQTFDILLLDIVMPLTNGIQLAEEIRTKDKNVKIIFISSTSAFAVDSYRVDAFYYIVKPIKQEILFAQLTKAITQILENQNKYIVVKKRNELLKVRFNQILYAEVVGHTTYLHLNEGELIKNFGSMSQLVTLLCNDSRFIKPHRSYVLNMDFIESISPSGIRTTKGQNIPISRNLFKEIKQAYILYSFQRSV